MKNNEYEQEYLYLEIEDIYFSEEQINKIKESEIKDEEKRGVEIIEIF